jgi:hypothetical protein
MGNPTGRIFFDGYGYGIVLTDMYVPVVIRSPSSPCDSFPTAPFPPFSLAFPSSHGEIDVKKFLMTNGGSST